jgi:cobaltochelatase CobN
VLDDIQRYADGLRSSPTLELDRITGALSGGYIPPSSGGDALFNPEAVPTGRNLYSINAEHTPSEEAWRVGKLLAGQIIARHRAENGRWPRQVAFTLWGSEFIRGKGTTLAEIMYLIGVRPVSNSRGSVYDVELIPAEELGRPRIDVLVQTSGQFRDAGASRITLLDKAITMVAELPDESVPNFVRDGSAATEQELKELGFAPKEARELSTARIFGSAANQSYGANIMGMVEKGDTWEDESQVANRYMRNMGGIYRDGNTWGTYKEGLLGAAMQGTEVVVHPRSSNTWGPLSLDHVYEFMGGITASIRHKTGNDPTGYFSDLRTRGRPKSTTAVAAIREEVRTTLWNPKYLTGMQREGAGAAADLTETVRNMYGWNVMQPSAIDQEMWDETYRVFIDDKHDLAMREYFEGKNPYALQDMTSVMLETARKGYWAPSEDVLQELARIHAELVAEFGAGCSYETCGNRKLQEFLNAQLVAPGSDVPAEVLDAYAASLAAVLESATPLPDVEGIELEEKTEEITEHVLLPQPVQTVFLAGYIVVCVLGVLTLGTRRSRGKPL